MNQRKLNQNGKSSARRLQAILRERGKILSRLKEIEATIHVLDRIAQPSDIPAPAVPSLPLVVSGIPPNNRPRA
jgi:hypothetical protein